MESVERNEAEVERVVHVSFRGDAGWRTCHRRYHLPRVISTIFIPTPFLHPPLFFFSHDGTRFFQAFISITGCINIRGVFLDLMKRMKNAKSFQLAHSTNSFLSRDILVCVRSNLYIYIYRNIHSC